MAQKDYYTILGVGKSATTDELKKAYRKLALQWHPDRHQGTDKKQAEEKFKEINKAYEVLSNPQKRSTYDQVGTAAFEQGGYGSASGANPFAGGFRQGGPFTYTYSSSGGQGFEDLFGGGFSDPFEIFEQFFGGSSPFGNQRRQRRSAYGLTIDFMEAVRGVEKEVMIEGEKKTIKIPAGVDDSTTIRFSEFDIVVSVRPSSEFQRRGQDVYIDFPITFTQASLGATVEVPTIDGSVTLKVRPGTQPSTLVRLRGRGIPYPNSSRRGDEYVRLTIHVPTSLTRKQKEILRELEEE